MRAIRVLILGTLILVAVLVLTRIAVGIYTDVLWYDEVGYLRTYWTRFGLRLGVRGAAALVGATILLANLWFVVSQLGPVRVRRRFANIEIAERVPRSYITALVIAVAVLGGWWLAELQFDDAAVLRAMSALRGVGWGVTDPVFGRDVAFYVFGLPFATDVIGYLALVLIWSTALVALGHVLAGEIHWTENRLGLSHPARRHLGALGAALLAILAARFWLGGYYLVVAGSGVADALGYTDMNARLPAQRIMAALSLVAAAALVNGAWRNALLPPVIGIGTLLVGGLVAAVGYPAIVQKFHVEPNELRRESPFIAWHMDFTRRAWGLDGMRREHFPYRRDARPTPARLAPMYARLPLWDTEPLLRAFNETQSLYPFYRFADVDFDRYGPPGAEQQVAVGVREFHADGLERASRTWQSLRLNPGYIRGQGAVVAPARPTTDGRGTHERWVENIEPVERHPLAPEALQLDRPSVFYGETMDGYVVVIPGRGGQFTGAAGVDHPRGVALSSFLRVLAFAARFGDETLLFAREITPESRLVHRRIVQDRARAIAPFLLWDPDALPVIFEGRIVWLLDGYTVSRSFPLARSVSLRGTRVRYLRNSVKAVVDAVSGDVAFYRLDPDDPILATYERVFPDIVRPLEAMPGELRRHLRYPEAAFVARADILQEYHLDRVEAFYAGQNVWQRPQQVAPAGGLRPYRPVRALMPDPLADTVEYLGAVPYIARGRQNMTALLMVRNEHPRYGELTLVEFPRDQQVPGPGQVQAMIEQDPIIAPELSLLRARGSQVDMGKLRVLPLDSAVLYVQPLFLSADENPIPEIWRVVVSDGRNVAMGQSLHLAVTGLGMGDRAVAGRAGPVLPSVLGETGQWSRQALDLLERAEARLRDGDWAGYGRVLDELRALLERASRGADPREEP